MTQEKNKSKMGKWTRRGFIGIGGLAGLGLVVGVGGNAYLGKAIKKFSGRGMGDGNALNAWINISPDNKITLAVARAEMGQGAISSVCQLIAEELEVAFEELNVIHPQPEAPYANIYIASQRRVNPFRGYNMMDKIMAYMPIIGTGGSTTIIDAWEGMRYAGATAREMLIAAAADQWSVDRTKCYAENGHVINRDTGEKLDYGSLSEKAIDFKTDKLPELKPQKDFKIVGKPVQRLDIPEKVNGTAKFGLDVKEKGMLYASVKHAEQTGNKITGITNEAEVAKMPGVKKIVLTEYGKVLVIADNSWRAINASRALAVTEEGNGSDDFSTEYYNKELLRIVDEKPIATPLNKGNAQGIIDNEISEGKKLIEATYEVPYLAHACMEPMNATVKIVDGKCEAWLGHQSTSVAHGMLEEATGIPKKDITMNITYLGGGFGRRGEPDFVRLAGAAAKAMQGTMVQTVFTREEDMKNDMYRPGAVCQFKGVVDGSGNLEALSSNVAIQSVDFDAMNRILPAMAPSPSKAKTTAEGLADQPYEIQNHKVSFGDFKAPVQVGFWRSVGYSQNGFFNESFIDECAHQAGEDPMRFRMNMVKDKPRYAKVLEKLAQISNWGKPAEGLYQGVALQFSFGSIAAEVAEIRKIDNKTFKIENYYCVIDCGSTVNPDTIEAQMQSGIIFGLTAAVYGEISWSGGKVDQSNFHDYQMLKLKQAPNISVAIMQNEELPGGVGEPGTPPAAPALTNAIFVATGERVRKLPLSKSGYTFV